MGWTKSYRQGDRYVGYADDCSIYIKSEKPAQRVMETITEYIGGKLKLKVNRTKNKVSQPTESTLLGFSFYRGEKGWEIRIAPKPLERIKKKIKGQTQRNDPAPARGKIKKMEAVIRGWVNYFSIAKAKSKMQQLDELVRTGYGIGIWKQWKEGGKTAQPHKAWHQRSKGLRMGQQSPRWLSVPDST